MKVAPKLVFLLRDLDGFASAIAEALRPNPPSSVRTLEESFELSLERYGIKDHKATGSILHYVDDRGVFQVSVLLLSNYEPPILACALNEVLAQIAGEDSPSSLVPTIVAPFVVSASKLKLERKSVNKNDMQLSLYGIGSGPKADITHLLLDRTQRLPSSLQIHHEPLACFLHLVRVLNLSTFVVVAHSNRSLSDKAGGEELQALHDIGELVASSLCLHFSGGDIVWKPSVISKDSKEPWRALYG